MNEIPYIPESEEFIIGSAIMGALKDDNESVLTSLLKDHFYGRSCSIAWESIQSLFQKGIGIDIFSVTESLKTSGKLEEIGGDSWLLGTTKRFFTNSTINWHVDILKEKYRLRKLIEISTDCSLRASKEEDAKIVLNDLEAKIFELGNESYQNENRIIPASISLKQLIDRRLNKENVEGLKTGLKPFDELTQGFQKGQYYVIGGRASSGKTAFADQVAVRLINKNIPFLYICLEASEERILAKIACKDALVNYSLFLKGMISDSDLLKIDESRKKIEKSNIIIVRPPEISGFEIRSLIRREKRKHGIELVILDYLQKVKIPDGWDERRAVSEASKTIQNTLVETGVPGLILVQLNRESEKEARPKMRHLKESGQIEQDADFVGLLFCEVDREELTITQESPTIMGIEKNKDGASFVDLELSFNKQLMVFKERNKNERSNEGY